MTNTLATVGMVVLALSRFGAGGANERTAGHVAALIAIVAIGYRASSSRRLSMLWTVLAFAVAWFWMPIMPLLALLGASVLRQPAIPTSAPETTPMGQATDAGQSGDGSNAVFTLRTAAEEFKDRVKAFAVDFGSIYGSQQIPFIVDLDGREHAVYVETAPWDRPATTRFCQWMAALRTSDREDLPVLIRSPHPVPIEISRYAEPTPGNAFELAGAMNVHWTDTPGFSELNAATVRRLMHEYAGVTVGDTVADLEVIDRFVAEHIAARGEPLPSTLILLGCYFGEVLVRQCRGTWVIAGQTTADVRVDVVTPKGALEANVFGKAGKLLRNGMEDSMAWMARSIELRINEPGGQPSA